MPVTFQMQQGAATVVGLIGLKWNVFLYERIQSETERQEDDFLPEAWGSLQGPTESGKPHHEMGCGRPWCLRRRLNPLVRATPRTSQHGPPRPRETSSS